MSTPKPTLGEILWDKLDEGFCRIQGEKRCPWDVNGDDEKQAVQAAANAVADAVYADVERVLELYFAAQGEDYHEIRKNLKHRLQCSRKGIVDDHGFAARRSAR